MKAYHKVPRFRRSLTRDEDIDSSLQLGKSELCLGGPIASLSEPVREFNMLLKVDFYDFMSLFLALSLINCGTNYFVWFRNNDDNDRK